MDKKIHTKLLFDYRLGLMWRTLPAAVRETYNIRALEVADEHKRKNPCKIFKNTLKHHNKNDLKDFLLQIEFAKI
jgi:hypothetical protein